VTLVGLLAACMPATNRYGEWQNKIHQCLTRFISIQRPRLTLIHSYVRTDNRINTNESTEALDVPPSNLSSLTSLASRSSPETVVLSALPRMETHHTRTRKDCREQEATIGGRARTLHSCSGTVFLQRKMYASSSLRTSIFSCNGDPTQHGHHRQPFGQRGVLQRGRPFNEFSAGASDKFKLAVRRPQSTAAVRGSERRPVLPLAIQVRVSTPSRISYLVSRPALAHL
jgi:hypothetical protein